MDQKRKPEHDDPMNPIFDDNMTNRTIVSANEVTGMVPRPPLDEAEVEGWLTLFPVEQQASAVARKADTPEEQGKKSSQ